MKRCTCETLLDWCEGCRQRLEKEEHFARRGVHPETIPLPEFLAFDPMHPPYDRKKLRHLVESLWRVGWRGPPVVYEGGQLLTGSHRFYAVRHLHERDPEAAERWFGARVVDVEDLFSSAGKDYAVELEAAQEEERGKFVSEMYRCLLERLPENYRDYFGIDLH